MTELADAIAAHERAAVRIAVEGEWAVDGSVSMTNWLRTNCRMSAQDAARLLRSGQFLERFPCLGAAAESGVLSSGQVAAIRGSVRRDTEPMLVEFEATMVEVLASLGIADTVTVCRDWQAKAEAMAGAEPKAEPERSLSWSTSKSSSGTSSVGRFVGDSAMTIQLEQAIATATTREHDDERPADRRRADALFDILSFFDANHDRSGTPRHRPHVELVAPLAPEVDAPGTNASAGDATTVNGDPIPNRCAEALMCDCVVHRVLRSGSTILDYGRAQRTVPYPLFRAAAHRDGGCRFPGCDRPVAWTDAHHAKFWRHGGPTRLENVCLLCSRHHHLVHGRGWLLELRPDATVMVTTPTGRVMMSEPRGSPARSLPFAA